MKKIIILISLFVLIGCINKVKEIKKDNYQINDYLKETDPINGNNYFYYFKKEKNLYKKQTVLYKLDSLVLVIKNKKYTLNLIHKNIFTDIVQGNIYANEDYNFDGVNDILIYPHVVNYSVYGNDYRANYFLFNKKTMFFEEESQLDSINNLEVDKKNKKLISKDSKKGLIGYYWVNDTLKSIKKDDKNNKQ